MPNRPTIQSFNKLLLSIAIISLIIAVASFFLEKDLIASYACACFLVSGTLALGVSKTLKPYRYTAWMITAFTLPLLFPGAFVSIGSFDLKHLILPLIIMIMFAMGTQMSLGNLRDVLKDPKGIFVGIFCQFLIMPLSAYLLITIVELPAEVAAGVILIGSCSSGLASNVMTWLARGNLALSITLTTCATLLAPLITPFWMKNLAGQLIEVDPVNMFFNIIKITILPVTCGLLYNQYIKNRIPTLNWIMPKIAMFGIIYYTLVSTALGRETVLSIGLLLVLVAVLHNSIGFIFGYWLSRLMGLSKQDCRTISIEVALQNGGMAVGLANAMGKLATVGLPSIIFSPWMNIAGSVIANYWRSHTKIEKED